MKNFFLFFVFVVLFSISCNSLWNQKQVCSPWPQCGCIDPEHGIDCPGAQPPPIGVSRPDGGTDSTDSTDSEVE